MSGNWARYMVERGRCIKEDAVAEKEEEYPVSITATNTRLSTSELSTRIPNSNPS
jgi:hypothetical protein